MRALLTSFFLLWAASESLAATTVEKRVAASADDAEEFADGTMYLTSSDLELIHDSSDQTVGMRWSALAIPPGATISAAYIQFSAKESQSDSTKLTIRGESVDNAGAFTSSSKNISNRFRTADSTRWTVDPWSSGETGSKQRTPDLSAVIQAIVSRPGWASGNALVIIITGSGHRTAWAYNGNASLAPLLHIEYGGGSPPPTDNPPVARLSVSPLASPALTVLADGSASTDTDATPIASYTFTFGDGSSVTTSSPTAQHTYASAGPYTVMLTATDTGGNASAPTSKSINVASSPPSGSQVAVYVGYYDTHHESTPKPKPNPWSGSSDVVFVGQPDNSSGGWDASAVRVANLTSGTLSGVVVTVDIGSHHYALWGTNSIPAGKTLILTQTAYENFDGSDTNPAGCYGCSASDCLTLVSFTIPVVHVTIGSSKTDYRDLNQILNTRGVDGAGCPYNGLRNDESHDWVQINASSPAATPNAAGEALASGPVLLAPPHPNPTRGDLAIRFRTAPEASVRLAVYDVAGRLVKTVLDDVLEPGVYLERVDLRGSAPGLYFCDLKTLGHTLHTTFVLVR